MKEVLAKQAKQRAMKEALDRQILEAERVRKEEALQAQRYVLPDNTRAVAVLPTEGPSPKVVAPHSGETRGRPQGNRNAAEAEAARYTFSFNGEQASFVRENGEDPQREAQRPNEAVNTKATTPKANTPTKGRASRSPSEGVDGKPSGGSPRAPADPVKPVVRSLSKQRQQQPQSKPERGAIVAALAEPKNRGAAAAAAAMAAGKRKEKETPRYQTNSLPVDLRDYALDQQRLGNGAGKGRRSVSNQRKAVNGEPTYDVRSLPVDLVYQLGKGGGGGGGSGAALEVNGGAAGGCLRLPAPSGPGVKKKQQQRPAQKAKSPAEATSQRGSTPEIEGISPATPPRPPSSGDYQTGCLPRDFAWNEVFAAQLLAAKGKAAGERGSPLWLSPSSRSPSYENLLGAKAGQGYTKDGRRRSPRMPGRPAGGGLPPLPHPNGSAECDNTIELSAVLDAPSETGAVSGGELRPSPPSSSSLQQLQQQPNHDQRTLAVMPTPDKRQGRPPRSSSKDSRSSGGLGSPQDVKRLQRQLDSRDDVVRRMQEKERSWEDQVQRLKAELRSARKKERELAKANNLDGLPPRAETAPDAPDPARGGRRNYSNERDRGNGVVAARGGGRGRVVATQELCKKPDFTRARIFTAEEFTPVAAPDFPDEGEDDAPVPRRHEHRSPVTGAKKKPKRFQEPPPQSTGSVNSAPLAVDAAANSSLFGVSETSLKLASLTTRQTAFGLLQEDAATPAPIAFDHLVEFADAQIITLTQAENLWKFFCALKGVAVVYDRHGAIARQPASHSGDGKSGAYNSDGDADDGSGGGSSEDSFSAKAAKPSKRVDRTPNSGRRNDYHQSSSSPISAVSAVLAPALRRKISRMHAGAAAVSDGNSGGGRNEDTGRNSGAAAGSAPREAATPPLSVNTSGEGRSVARRQAHLAAQSRQSPSLPEKGGGSDMGSGRSPVSRGSSSALYNDGNAGSPVVLLSSGQGRSTSKEGRHASRGVRRDRVVSNTFDTSAELFASSDQ